MELCTPGGITTGCGGTGVDLPGGDWPRRFAIGSGATGTRSSPGEPLSAAVCHSCACSLDAASWELFLAASAACAAADRLQPGEIVTAIRKPASHRPPAITVSACRY